MKSINKTTLFFITLFAVVAFGACSTADAPNEPENKDAIDVDFLSRLARGEESAVYSLEDMDAVVKSYDPATGIDGDWWDHGLVGWQYPDHSYVMMTGSKAWRPLSLENFSTWTKSILYHPWIYFCEVANMTKPVRVACLFEIDIPNKKFMLDRVKYDIEEARGNKLVLADIEAQMVPDSVTHERVPGLLKFVLSYTVQIEDLDPDGYLYFESDKEAKLGMVQMMREYFGDRLDLTEYAKSIKYNDRILENPIIDLAALEDDIANDRDE